MDQIALTSSQFEDFQEIRRRVLRDIEEVPAPDTSRKDPSHRSSVVMLLEEIESGQSGRAAVLEGVRSLPKFFITVYGNPIHSSYFKLRWFGEEISSVDVNATPQEMKQSIESFSFIGSGGVSVSFGNHVRLIHGEAQEFNVFRWLVTIKESASSAIRNHENFIDRESFKPTPAAQGSGFWVASEMTRLLDTGATIRIESSLPIGNSRSGKTPQQPGAVAIVDWIDSIGWTVNAIEARYLDTSAEDEIDYV